MLRQWPPISEGYSENFASLNRNKRSLALDLKNPEHKKMAQALIRSADVVIENNRPGVMDRLGLGYAAFKDEKPGLVYCSISAFGQTGPRSGEGGFDVTVQAVSGIMSVTGEPDGAPVKCGVPVSDFSAGLYGAFAIAAKLREVQMGGRGGHIDVSMLGASLGIAALQTSEYFGTGRDPRKLGSAHPRNAPYQAFRCSDGHFVMAAGNDELYRRACAGIGREELIEDPRFSSTALRARNQEALKALLETTFAGMTAEQCLEAMRRQGVPCAPINSYSQALADPQVAHYGWVQPLELPGGGTTRTFASPLGPTRLGSPPTTRPGRPPALGEHTAEILKELGG